jgi:multiple sugar transport system permease protein
MNKEAKPKITMTQANSIKSDTVIAKTYVADTNIAKSTVANTASRLRNSGTLTFGQVLLNLALICMCSVSMIPFLWTISTSLRPQSEAFNMPPHFFPTSFMYENYAAVFKAFPFFRFITNSLLTASGVVILSLTVTTMAAYSFARINFRFKGVIFLFFMAGLMVPGFATLISTYLIMARFGLVNTLWPLILPAAISPLHIFLVRQFMMTIPRSYDESAEIDGASRLTILFFIILPMVKPVLMLAALQSFVGSWNNFIGPLVYIHDFDRMTIPIGLRLLQGYMGMGNISEILSGVVISLIMPVLLYIFGQRYLIEGVVITGIKS